MNLSLQPHAMLHALHAVSRRMASLLPSCLGVSPCLLPFLLGGLLGVWGCKDLTGSPGLPSGTPNPVFYNNAAGALGMRNAAVFEFEQALPQYIVDAGLLTDELESLNTGASVGVQLQTAGVTDPLDERILPEGFSYGSSYANLGKARGFANQALGALAAYDTAAADMNTAKILRGELYAFEGYAEIMLADLYCSGVPLSTLDFQQNFTYAPSSTGKQVYQDALAKFDTALTLASASDSVVHLAQVGKGRVYLDLGQYAAAADDVSAVPDGFLYQLAASWQEGAGVNSNRIADNNATVSDREGENGLPFLSSGDPRTTVDTVAKAGNIFDGINLSVPLMFPTKYSAGLSGNGYAPITLASGVEARLIQAEAALQAGEAVTWIQQLNNLRTNGNSSTTTRYAVNIFDTLWVTGCASDPAGCPDSVPASTSYAGFTIDSVFTVTVTPGSDAYNVCYNDAGSTLQECDDPYIVVAYSKGVLSTSKSYEAGTGGVSGLAPLTDPGTSLAQVSLMFNERAYWLFFTGHRQGDLRRLLRQYGQYFQVQNQVYPTGLYLAPGTGQYGADVTVPIDPAESANPLFHGCLDRKP
jgi:hypothetical protein